MKRFLLLPLLLLAALLAGCGKADGKASLPTPSEIALGVRVVEPQSRLDDRMIRVTGRLLPKNESLVSARASGSIAELLVDVGDTVTKGQPMARLDVANVRIALEQATAAEAVAKAGFENSTLELERARKLRASGGVAQAQLDRAEAGHAQATAGLKQATAAKRAAQQALYDHTLRAPFDGRVVARLKNVGEYVSMMPATPIFSVVDVDALEVVLPVPETVIAAVSPGTTVRGMVNPSGQGFSAKVRVVGEVVDPQARTVEVRADLEGERGPQMRPHAIVEVDFVQGESLQGLFLPRQALRGAEEARFVWLVQDGVLVKRPIQAEVLSPGTIRVVSGLEGGERVVSDASGSFAEGMKVRALQ